MTTTDDNLLGTDLFFDGQLGVTGKGDFQVVTGDENLRRAILRRLSTNPGEYRVRPDYGAGVPAFLKKPNTKANRDLLRTRIVEQVSEDRRVDKVLECAVEAYTFSGVPGIQITLTVQSIGRDVRFQPFDFVQEF